MMKGHKYPSYFEPIAGFEAEKAIDLIVFFAAKSGNKISKLKLVKLIYLTEREHAHIYGIPSLLDEYYSLRHGPVGSSTLNIIDKKIKQDDTISIFRLRGKDVSLSISKDEWEFDHLSKADLICAERVWAMHGNKTASQIRNYTHAYCQEYTHVEEGRVEIRMEDLLNFAGAKNPSEVSDEVASLRRVSAVYS